jgi:ABC-type transport system involved in multi-copper enzyme maturation permease subunit
MEATAPRKPVVIKRWLPYWAVFQADVRQTLQSWVYRAWVLLSLLAAAGYLLYRYAPYHEAGLIQSAAGYLSDLLRWTLLGSAALVVVLTGGSISSERGTVADSVLSRGISRYQYFLGKWHARLAAVLLTYLLLGALALAASMLFLQEDLSVLGSAVALVTVAALLGAVISCGVAVSAVANSTLAGIAVLWLVLYGGGFAMSLLPPPFPAPDRVLRSLPDIVRGQYHLLALGRLVGWCAGASCVAAVLGMAYFGRRDV